VHVQEAIARILSISTPLEAQHMFELQQKKHQQLRESPPKTHIIRVSTQPLILRISSQIMFHHSKMSLSGTASFGLMSSSSLPEGINSTMASLATLASPTALANRQIVTQTPRSWFGLLVRCIVLLLSLVTGVLFWLITFATITIPTFLFNMFSTTLTFTLNATTLYATKLSYSLSELTESIEC
jgi:hypothetical protein